MANWTERLENGDSRAEVVLGFSESREFVNNTANEANTFATGSTASKWSDEVYRLYQATLDRRPDVGGHSDWIDRLASGERTLQSAADGFVRSVEFQNTYGGDLTSTEFVTLLYNNVLDRGPDAGGLANWTGRLDDGDSRAEVVLGFSQSREFTANSADGLKAWMRDQGVNDRIDPGTSDNLVAGGRLADVFIFSASNDGSTTVADLEAWDMIELNGFGYDTAAQARAQMSQSGVDLVFDDQGVEITFRDITMAQITDDMILL